MLFLLILPVLVAGFFACHIHPVYSYRLHRYEGQYLYLKSAELGIKCFAIALLLAVAAHYALPDFLYLGLYEINIKASSAILDSMMVFGASTDFEARKMTWVLTISVLLFVAAFILKLWGHVSLRARFGVWDARIYVIAKLLEDSPLDHMLFNISLDKKKFALVSLDDRKVYVGKVVSLGEPSETSGMDQDVSIMPIMSGYRNKDTLQIKFTTSYEEVGVDVTLSLRQESIVSATEFDFIAYKKFLAANPGEGETIFQGIVRKFFKSKSPKKSLSAGAAL